MEPLSASKVEVSVLQSFVPQFKVQSAGQVKTFSLSSHMSSPQHDAPAMFVEVREKGQGRQLNC